MGKQTQKRFAINKTNPKLNEIHLEKFIVTVKEQKICCLFFSFPKCIADVINL